MKILSNKTSKTETDDAVTGMLTASSAQTVPPAKLPQYLITAAVTLIVFAGGTIIGWSSPALPELESPTSLIPVTKEQSSWIGSLLPIGAFIGALPAGTVADIFGRKLTILSLSAPLAVCWLMIHLASSVSMLYIARLIGGVALGAICATVPLYVAEISDDSIRGTLGSSFQLMLVVGILYTYILGAIVHYSWLPILCGFIIIVFVGAFLFAPESPLWLLKKDRRTQAETALRKLRGPEYNIYSEIHYMENELTKQYSNKVSFLRVMAKRASILSMIICLGLMFFQQMSGINIVIFFSGNIFKDAGSSLDPAIATIIVGLSQVVSTLVAAALIDRAGRKILLQFSAAIMSVCLGILGYYFRLKTSGQDVSSMGMIPVVAVVIYILVFAVGFGPIPWMISGEVLPAEIKGPGTGIAAAVNWILAFAVTKSFQPLIDAVGPAGTYWIFAATCILAFIFVTFVVIETKGKSLSEVQEELSGIKTRKSNAVV